jgi:hypothetical protein
MQSRNPMLRRATEQAKADGAGALAAEGEAAYNSATQGAAVSGASAEQLLEMYDKSGRSAERRTRRQRSRRSCPLEHPSRCRPQRPR